MPSLSSKLNPRKVGLFLFFLVLSTAFWLIQALGETYREEIDVPLALRGVPEGVVLTTPPPAALRVAIRDKGAAILAYRFRSRLDTVNIDFATVANASGRVVLSASELLKQVQPHLFAGTTLLSAKPDAVEITYCHGQAKRVPVRTQGEVSVAQGYAITHSRLSADSVTVYATPAVLDTLRAAYLRPLYLRGLTASRRRTVPVEHVRGAKFVPDRVAMSVYVDRLVECRVTVPVEGVGFPPGEVLRTFPPQVDVVCQVGMKDYRDVRPADFHVAVSYAELQQQPDQQKCQLRVTAAPVQVSGVRLPVSEVDYVVEHVAK